MQKLDLMDDKDLAIIVLCIIALASIFTLGAEAKDIVLAVVSAIAGFVTGRKAGGSGGSQT